MGTKFTAHDRILKGKLNSSLGSSSWLTTLKENWKITQEQLGVLEASIKGIALRPSN